MIVKTDFDSGFHSWYGLGAMAITDFNRKYCQKVNYSLELFVKWSKGIFKIKIPYYTKIYPKYSKAIQLSISWQK